jgi:hypothetical protein
MIAQDVYLNIINSKTFKPLISTRMKSPCASLELWLESCMSTASRSGERVERAACGSRYLYQVAWPAGCCQKTWQSHEDTIRWYPIPTQFLKIKSWRNRDVRELGSVKSCWASPFEYMKITSTSLQNGLNTFQVNLNVFQVWACNHYQTFNFSPPTSALRHAWKCVK